MFDYTHLKSPGIVVGQREVIVSALEKYSKGKADFGDYLILAEGELYSAPTVTTFDQAFCKATSSARHPKELIK
jgi:predicted nucleic-acid-binding protein